MAFWLSGILALSLFVRGFSFTSVPPELFGDEVDVGYQAYSLFKTGRDLYAQAFPTYIHSLSEWRAPLLMYATVPTVAAFGTSELGVRLPQVIFGSLAPIILMLLVYHTTRSRPAAILASLSLSLLPWHIHYSRVAFEVVIMLDLMLLGTLLYLKRRFSLSLLFFALTFYTYSTAVIFTPLWLLALLLLTRKKPNLLALLLFTITITPFIFNLISGRAQARFGLVSIFTSQEVIDKITNFRQYPSVWETVFHNKPESYFSLFFSNYLRAFSPEFLFVRGDPAVRHNMQYIGQLLPLTAPFLILGLYHLVIGRRWLWLVWLGLAPLPSALTIDGAFHATRLFLMIPPLAVAVGIGISQVVNLKSPILNILLLLLFTLHFSQVAHYYLVHYPTVSWRWWHVGYKSAMREINRLAPDYPRVFINSTYEPSLIRFLFYSAYPPADFHRQFSLDQPLTEIQPGYSGFPLGEKYFFGTFTAPPAQDYLLPDSLYLISQRDDVPGDWDWRTDPPQNIQVLNTVTNPDHLPIFYLVTRR
ncbi:hypothetical protein A2W16_01020 [Candidatus Amesbacteria bacterium RBG_16_48_31]|nr:MAG: hypothetical protein A2W16_01020 [Candidatus Amesbacteria bacterium RBG_16_48_31]